MGLLVGDVIRHAARVVPGKTAATLGDAEITFADVEARSNQLARVLARLGVGHRDRVAWWGETSLEAMPIFGACAKLGAPFMPVNARIGAGEAAGVLEYSRPRIVITDALHAALDPPFAVAHQDELFNRAADESSDDVREPALDERDTHVVFFTSGSTGRPKGVVLSHRVSCLRSFPSWLTGGDTHTVCMFPLFHMAGWSMTVNAWQVRQPLHFAAPDERELLATVERRRATRLYCIPAVWARVLEHDRAPYDLSSLRECDTGTSATPPELLAAIKQAFPRTVTRVYYGSTEAGPVALLADADVARKPGSVGMPTPGVEVRLDAGELCVRSELLMDGYFEAPDATAAALGPLDENGPPWYRTGDLAAIDDEGYISIVGRARDVLRTGGETVAPSEVESVLADHPAVVDVAVVGLPDPQWGEVVCAVVVPASDRAGELDVDALRAYCDGRLAPFKQPRRVELVDALPRTAATGQVQRILIVERLTARDA